MSNEGECPLYRADPSSQNPPGDLTPKLNKSEVIDLTNLGKHGYSITWKCKGTNMDNVIGDESSDDDEGEGERNCPSSRSRSSSILQDARYSAWPVATKSPTLSPLSGTIQAGDTVTHGDSLFMADIGISSSDQPFQRIVEPLQSQEPDQGKRPRSANAFTMPNSSKANIHRSQA